MDVRSQPRITEMKLNECLSRTFVALNFFSFLAKSDLAYTFLAMVRSPTSPFPPSWFSALSPTLRPLIPLRSRTYPVNFPQTGPAVGISFCLIIVRLGRTLPEAQDETWHISFHTPASQVSTSDQVAVSFEQDKVQRDVHTNEPTPFPMGTLKSSQETDMTFPTNS